MSEAVHTGWLPRDGDRRRKPTPILCRYTFVGRRRGFRREGERANAYVDRYGPGLFTVLLAIIVLCTLDALFTIAHVRAGGSEVNPLMRAAMEAGTVPFLSLKCGLTAAALTFLCLHKNFRWVERLLYGILGFYVLLTFYHLHLALAR